MRKILVMLFLFLGLSSCVCDDYYDDYYNRGTLIETINTLIYDYSYEGYCLTTIDNRYDVTRKNNRIYVEIRNVRYNEEYIDLIDYLYSYYNKNPHVNLIKAKYYDLVVIYLRY